MSYLCKENFSSLFQKASIHSMTALAVFVMFGAYNASYADDQCIEKRYVFELGSGSTRMTNYVVNQCKNSIEAIESLISRRVPYQKCVNDASNKSIAKDCIQIGIATMKEMQGMHNIDCKVEKCTGFATAWSRNAANTDEVVKNIREATGITVYPISQEEEALLSFKTAREILINLQKITADENFILLDIGGGSFQITSIDPETKEFVLYKGLYGTEVLSKEIYSHFKQKRAAMIKCDSVPELYKLLNKKVIQELYNSPEIKRIKSFDNSNLKLYSVGSAAMVGLNYEFEMKDPISQKALEDLIQKVCGLSFEKIGQLFPKRKLEYMQMNQAMFLFVHSIMESLNKEEMHIVPQANAANSVVLNDVYWKHLEVKNTEAESVSLSKSEL